jgi:hypothetical protein
VTACGAMPLLIRRSARLAGRRRSPLEAADRGAMRAWRRPDLPMSGLVCAGSLGPSHVGGHGESRPLQGGSSR